MADESVIHIRIDPSGAVTGGRVVVNTIDRIDRAADKAVGSVDLLSSALFSLGLGLGIREINNYADAWARTTNRIRLHTDSLETLTAIQEELFQSSQRVSVSYETSVALFDKLSSSGEKLGLSFRDVLDITELVNKTISISGASTEAASRAIFQLGQALSIGTLYAEEFNSILENLPRLANVIADGMGKTVGEIKRAGPEAKVTAEQIIKSIKDQADEINRDFSNTQANIGSSFQRLQNSTLRFVGELDKTSGITSLFAEAITSLSNSLDTMREKGSPILTELFKPYTEQLKQLIKDHPEVTTNILLFTGALVGLASTGRMVSFTFTSISNVLRFLGTGISRILNPFSTLGALFTGGAAKARTFLMGLKALISPWNLIATAILGTVTALFKYKDAVVTIEGQTFAIRDLFVAAWEIIKEKTGDLVEFISEQFTLITDVWTNFPNVIDSVWGQGTFNTIRDWFTNVVNTTAEFLKWMINAFLGLSRSLMDIGQALSDTIGHLFKRMFDDTIEETGEYAKKRLKELQSKLGENLSKDFIQEYIDTWKEAQPGVMGYLNDSWDYYLDTLKPVFEKAGQSYAERLKEGFEDNKSMPSADLDSPLGEVDPNAKTAAEIEKEKSELKKLQDAYRSLRSEIDPVYGATLDFADAVTVLNHAFAAGLIPSVDEFQMLLRELEGRYEGLMDPLIGKYQELRHEFHPVLVAQEEFNEKLQILDHAYSKGKFNQEEYAKATVLLINAYRDILDPITKYEESLEKELLLSRLWTKEKNIQIELMNLERQLEENGIELTDTKRETLRGFLEELQKANETTQDAEELYNSIIAPQERYRKGLQALANLLDEGKISLSQYNEELRKQKAEYLTSKKDFPSGFERGFLNLEEYVNNFSNLSESLVVNSFQNMEDALVSFTSTGRLEFRDFANAIMADITRIAVRMLIIRPLLGLFGKAFNFDGAPVPGDADFIGPLQKEKGGDIKGGITYLVNEKKVEKSSVPGYFRPLNSDKVFDIKAGYIQPPEKELKKNMEYSTVGYFTPKTAGSIIPNPPKQEIKNIKNETNNKNLSSIQNNSDIKHIQNKKEEQIRNTSYQNHLEEIKNETNNKNLSSIQNNSDIKHIQNKKEEQIRNTSYQNHLEEIKNVVTNNNPDIKKISNQNNSEIKNFIQEQQSNNQNTFDFSKENNSVEEIKRTTSNKVNNYFNSHRELITNNNNYFNATYPLQEKEQKVGIQFGGYREFGGSVYPGKAYVVNEKRTEITNVPGLFMPLKPGYIQPNNNQQGSSSNKQDKSSVTERNIHLTVNVSGIKSEEEARYVGKKVGRSAGMELIQMLKLGGRSE